MKRGHYLLSQLLLLSANTLKFSGGTPSMEGQIVALSSQTHTQFCDLSIKKAFEYNAA